MDAVAFTGWLVAEHSSRFRYQEVLPWTCSAETLNFFPDILTHVMILIFCLFFGLISIKNFKSKKNSIQMFKSRNFKWNFQIWKFQLKFFFLCSKSTLCCFVSKLFLDVRCSAARRRAEGGAGREGPALPQPAQHEALAQPQPVHPDPGQREGGARVPGTQGDRRSAGEFWIQSNRIRPSSSSGADAQWLALSFVFHDFH